MKFKNMSKISVSILASTTLLTTITQFNTVINPTVFAKDYRKTQSNHNKARNWELSDGIPLMQQINSQHQITYQINATTPLYKQAYQRAVKAWNRVGVITLVPTTTNPQITMNESKQNLVALGEDGNTDFDDGTETQTRNGYQFRYLLDAVIEIQVKTKNRKPKPLLQYTTYVAEHEIGHALGLDHDNTTDDYNDFHVMDSDYSYNFLDAVIPLGKYERDTLLQHYQHQF